MNNWPYWFELAVLFGLTNVGGIALQAFAVHESKWRRLLKLLFGGALAVTVSATVGRAWLFALVGLGLVAVLVIHAWWLPRKGVNGWTAEPRDKYFALRGWTDK